MESDKPRASRPLPMNSRAPASVSKKNIATSFIISVIPRRLAAALLSLWLAAGLPARHAAAAPPDDPRRDELYQKAIDGLRGEDAGKRRQALVTLSTLGDARAIPELLQTLQHDEPELQVLAAKALGATRDPLFLDTLDDGFDDLQPRTRQALVFAIARLEDQRAIPALVNLLQDDQTPVRDAAWNSLRQKTGMELAAPARAGDATPDAAAWQAWWRDAKARAPGRWWQDIAVRLTPAEQVRVIGKIREHRLLEAIPTLVDLLTARAPGVRAAAEQALRDLAWREFRPAAATAPKNEAAREAEFVAAWRDWLRRVNPADPIAVAVDALQDRLAVNRLAAIQALTATGKVELAAALIPGLRDAAVPVRAAAADGLWRITGRKMGAPSPEDAQACEKAARLYGRWLVDRIDKPRVELIIEALTEPDGSVQVRALRELEDVNPWVAVEQAMTRLEDGKFAVRHAAAELLRRRLPVTFGYDPELPDGDTALRLQTRAAWRRAREDYQSWWRLHRDTMRW